MFDYVIAGAGSAGCIPANRLSEDPKTRVCLLEARERPNLEIVTGGNTSAPTIVIGEKAADMFLGTA